MIQFQHYSDWLNFEFETRKSINPKYSLRAFAKKLEMSPAKLSEVLRKKQGLSQSIASRIAKKLNLSTEEREVFINMVQSLDARSKATRLKASQDLQNYLQQDAKKLDLEELNDQFEMISDWHNSALMELIKIGIIQEDILAQKLDISMEQVKKSLYLLHKLKLITIKDGGYFGTLKNFKVGDLAPSAAIRKFHTQILSKAIESIENQSIDKRTLSALTIAIDEEILPQVFKKIKDFRSELNEFISNHSSNKSPNTVYCASIQFFDLTKQ